MTEDSGPSGSAESSSCSKPGRAAAASDSLSSQRVFKKCSPNNKLTLYLSSRDLVVSSGKIDRLQGVLLVDPEFVEQRKVYGQVTLTFRYGREDEEVMGLKFCNEAVMCLAQLYPPHSGSQPSETNSPLQEALIKRLGPNAYSFTMEITPLAPPSVQLVPAKEYNGAPIGTSYDIRAYVADRADEKLHRRTTVRMGIRVVQRAYAPPSPYLYSPGGTYSHTTPNDRRGNRYKITLFGCKSAPVDCNKPYETYPRPDPTSLQLQMNKMNNEHRSRRLPPQIIARSPSVPSMNGREDGEFTRSLSGRVEAYIDDVNDAKTPSQVSFQVRAFEGADAPDAKKNDAITIDENEGKKIENLRSSCGSKRPSLAAFLAEVPPPHAMIEKPFLLSDGRIELEAFLNKGIYYHGEEVHVTVTVRNNSNKTVRRLKVFVVQHVDVCMFSNGKFKNVVASINAKDDCPITSGVAFERTYSLVPIKSSTKNWIALEDSYTKSGTSLASTVTRTTHPSSTSSTKSEPDERNVFAIYVSYYVKVKLLVSLMGGEVSLKLPFTLMHTCHDLDSPVTPQQPQPIHEKPAQLTVQPSPRPEERKDDSVKSEKDVT